MDNLHYLFIIATNIITWGFIRNFCKSTSQPYLKSSYKLEGLVGFGDEIAIR